MNMLNQINDLIESKIAICRLFFKLLRLETKLAGLSLAPLLLMVCLLMVFLQALWIVTMLLIGYLIFLWANIISATISLIIINLIFLISAWHYLKYNLKAMSFVKTRSLLSAHEGME